MEITTKEQAVEYLVNRGVKELDDHFGDDGWRAWIDLDILNMEDESRCVLGQLFGDYSNGKNELRILHGAEFGFCEDEVDGFWISPEDLEAQWRKVISN